MSMQNQIGSLAADMEADIVAFERDPLKDLNAARRTTFVMKGGKVYKNLDPRN